MRLGRIIVQLLHPFHLLSVAAIYDGQRLPFACKVRRRYSEVVRKLFCHNGCVQPDFFLVHLFAVLVAEQCFGVEGRRGVAPLVLQGFAGDTVQPECIRNLGPSFLAKRKALNTGTECRNSLIFVFLACAYAQKESRN